MTRRQHLGIAVAAGLVSGLVVLGVGGRIAMRIVAYTTPEPEELTLTGTLLVIGIGAGWGAITAPILVLLQGTAIRDHRWLGVGFGGVVLALALLAPLVALAFGERLVAPGAFIVVSGVLFPALFLAHGAATVWLARRWDRGDNQLVALALCLAVSFVAAACATGPTQPDPVALGYGPLVEFSNRREVEVGFPGADGAVLSGTLVLPRAPGRYAALVMHFG